MVKPLSNKAAQAVFREGMSQNLWEEEPGSVTSRLWFGPGFQDQLTYPELVGFSWTRVISRTTDSGG